MKITKKTTKADLIAFIQSMQNTQKEQTAKIDQLIAQNNEKEQMIIELKTKNVQKGNVNRTSKGQKNSKNMNTCIDILVFLFQHDESEMKRLQKGKEAIFDYSDIISFMQSDSRKEIGDRWAEKRWIEKDQKFVGSSYILFASTDWNFKTSSSCLGRHMASFGFYTKILKKGTEMRITKFSPQNAREKGLHYGIIEKRHDLIMEYIESQKNEGEEKMSKDQFIQQLNDLK